MRNFIVLLSIVLLPCSLFAQLENSNWIFRSAEYKWGECPNGIPCPITHLSWQNEDFQVLKLPIDSSNTFKSFEGVVAISDCETGELLFAFDGDHILDFNNRIVAGPFSFQHNPMLDIHSTAISKTQNIIVRKPASRDTFYVFSSQQDANTITDPEGGYFLKVHACREKGISLIHGSKPFHNKAITEKLYANMHADGESIWIVGHEWDNNNFFAYLLTSEELNPMPVISSVGAVMNESVIDGIVLGGFAGELKFSPDGSLLAYTVAGDGITELFAFDKQTGRVSNPRQLELIGCETKSGYGVSFSPDNSKLYVTCADFMNDSLSCIVQFDLSILSEEAINASAHVIRAPSLVTYGSLKLGIDNKIYINNTISLDSSLARNHGYLGVINNPNASGDASDYNPFGIALGENAGSHFSLNNLQETFGPCPELRSEACKPAQPELPPPADISQIPLPTAFSPNSDGLNDRWPGTVAGGNGLTPDGAQGTVQIFSRWGTLVYSGPLDPGWDGRAPSGAPAPEGVYMYVYLSPSGQQRTGSITLVR